MADSKITALTSIGTSTDPVLDQMVIVDVSDGSMAATGTTKKVSLNQLLSSNPSATGGLTLSGALAAGSATISGDLTVDTNSLYVNSSTNNVGLGTLTPSGASGRALEIYGGAGQSRLALKNDTTGSASTDGSQIALVGSQLVIQNREASEITFETNNSERYRLASDGVATWSNVGGVAGTAMTLNSTGLGVGGSPNFKLDVAGAANSAPITLLRLNNTGTTGGGPGIAARLQFNAGATALGFVQGCNFASGSIGVQISGDGTNIHQTIDSSGNVGIGVTPSASWAGGAVIQQQNGAVYANSSLGSYDFSYNSIRTASNSYVYAASSLAAARFQLRDGAFNFFTAPSGTAGTAITFTQAMTLDASGNLLVRCTTAGSEQLGVQVIGYTNGNYVRINHNASAASGDSYLNFFYNATQIGSVTQSGTTGVAFNATSDYRLKESVQPITGALSRISALKPSIYKWKVDGSSGEGFLAHELAEAVPLAVTGEKDAVNEDGSIKPQQVDLSKVVPVLVAAIQELTARVQTLETR